MVAHDVEKAPGYTTGSDLNYSKSLEAEQSGEKSSITVNADLLDGEIVDEKYGSTQRGLSSRHIQMLAIGGTIGTG